MAMPMLECDVCVVGGGPSGAAAATLLARAGRHVVLVDKATFPRDKICGDGLTTACLRRLEALGLRPETVASWQTVDDLWVRSPSGRQVRYPLPHGDGTGVFAAVARRVDLDAALLELAAGAGVKVYDGHALRAAVQDPQGVTLDVDGLGAIRARYAIGADGHWSPLAKALGLRPETYLGEWHAFRQYFTNVGERAAREMWVWFEPDLLPGYVWSFPLPGGRANVGFGIERVDGESAQVMKKLWPELLARPHIREVLGSDAVPEAPHRAWPIPARIDKAVLSAGRVLFVGDAAAACDVLTGEGIGQALETAMLAAEAMLRAGPEAPWRAVALYNRSVQRTLVADHRMSTWLTGVMRREWGARGAVRVSGATAWTRRKFVRWLFEDEPRGVLLTPRRWHTRFLRRPGAFAGDGPTTAT